MAHIKYASTLSNGCGIGYWNTMLKSSLPLTGDETYGGCGWQIAAFIRGTVYKETYTQLKEKYKIVMQSPVRYNRNSANNFMFVVYDVKRPRWIGKTKGVPKPFYDLSTNDNYKWPFK